MTYIKINKNTLDYHHHSDFHVFTMNNFIRNVMQNGKYKKALRLVRLGLLFGYKELLYKLRLNDAKVIRTYKTLKRTFLHKKTQDKLQLILKNKNEKYKSTHIKAKGIASIGGFKYELNENKRLLSHQNLVNKLSPHTYSIDDFFNAESTMKIKPAEKLLKNHFKKDGSIEKERNAYMYTYPDSVGNILRANDEVEIPEQKIDYQYNFLTNLKFKKIYSKRSRMRFYGKRSLTVFDMIVQVYTMLTGVWYMRKSKISGRTILIPSPLRPYRRVTTVTKMLLKGIRKRQREDRYDKNAMIQAIGIEFYWLLLYQDVQYGLGTMIDNSYVWNNKTDSHKELVANLKNIKHLKYI